jgi:hypothetical protein
VEGRQPHAPTAFTPRRNAWYSFLEAESIPGHVVPSIATEKIPSVTPPGIDPDTFRLVAQFLDNLKENIFLHVITAEQSGGFELIFHLSSQYNYRTLQSCYTIRICPFLFFMFFPVDG